MARPRRHGVDWFNNRRFHGTIGYVPPGKYESNCHSYRMAIWLGPN